MIKAIKLICVSVSAIYFTGCTTALTSQGRAVRLFQGEKHPSCEYVGFVDGSSSMGWGLDQDLIRARNEMLNHAGSLGANWVKINHSNGNAFSTNLSGTAYRCDSNANMRIDTNDYTAKINPAAYNALMTGSNQVADAFTQSRQMPVQAPTQNNNWKSGQAPFCVMDNYGNLECYYYDLQSCQRASSQKLGASGCVKQP